MNELDVTSALDSKEDEEAEKIAFEAVLTAEVAADDFDHGSEDEAGSAGASVGEAAICNEDNEGNE